MPCKLSFRAALVAAALAALAARQVTSAQFVSLEQDCKGNNFTVVKSPQLTGPDQAFEIEVFVVDQKTADACSKEAADFVCLSSGFVFAGPITQSGSTTKGECLMTPPAQFDSLAQDCNEDNIKIIKSPGGPTDPLHAFIISAFEQDQRTTDACGKAAANILCKSLGFVSTGSISQSFAYTKGECLMGPPPGQFDSLAQDCNENRIKIIKSPVGPTDFDRAFEIEVSEVDQETANACGKAAADILCKSLRFLLTGSISQSGSTTKGECLMGPPGQFDSLAQDCNENDIRILKSPGGPTDPDQAVEIEVFEVQQVASFTAAHACGKAAADIVCKSSGFKLSGFILHSGLRNTKGKCLMDPPTASTAAVDRFRALASECNEERIIILREPSATDDDLTVRVEIDEFSEVALQTCGLAAAKETCKTNIRGFATAVQLDRRGRFVQGVCSN